MKFNLNTKRKTPASCRGFSYGFARYNSCRTLLSLCWSIVILVWNFLFLMNSS